MNLQPPSSRSKSKDIADLHTLNDVECDSLIDKAKTNVAANNSSFCVLMIGIFATIAIICVALAIATSALSSLIINSDRHLLSSSSDNNTDSNSSLISIEELLTQAPPNSTEDKVLGTLLGSAIGDALGVPLEFHFGQNRLYKDNQGKLAGKKIGNQLFRTWDVVDFTTRNMTKYPGRHTDYIRAVDVAMTMSGGGFFRAKPGMSSDDTAMAIQMARGLIATKPHIMGESSHVGIKDIQQNIFEQYFKWANPNRDGTLKYNNFSIRNKPFDIGLTIGGIYNAEDTVDVATVLNKTNTENIKTFQKFGSRLWSNGALMRIAPMPVYCMHLSDNNVFKVVRADIDLTNNNHFVAMAATVYVLMMKAMINGGSPQDAFNQANDFLQRRVTLDTETGVGKHKVNGTMVVKKEKPSIVILGWIDEITKNNAEQPECCDKQPDATITTGFKQGIWYLNAWAKNGINNPSYTDIMRHIFLGKGDTDTNAAIVGSMLGAALGIHGIRNEPNGLHWLQTLLSCSVKPHPRVLNAAGDPQDVVQADHNPYLARVYITENIWQKLIQSAPKAIFVTNRK